MQQPRGGVGVKRMAWVTPAFVEIKMDAEIGSYQDDFDRDNSDGI